MLCGSAPYLCVILAGAVLLWRAPGTAEQQAQKHVPRSPRCASLLISKSLLHREGNHLPASGEANQIKQSGKEDSLFISLTRSPRDFHSRAEILLQLLLDASPMLLVLPPWLTQAGTCQHWVRTSRGAPLPQFNPLLLRLEQHHLFHLLSFA